MNLLRAVFCVGDPPPSALARWLLFFAVAFVLRSASLAYDVMDIDQAHWSLIGRMVLDGAIPYVDFADHKPPLLFYLFGGFAALTGGNLRLQALLVMVWVALTAACVQVVARRLTGSPRAGFGAGVAYVALTSCNVVTANGELLSDLPMAAALVVLTHWSPPQLVLAGALTAIAALIRPQAAVLGVALAGTVALSALWTRLPTHERDGRSQAVWRGLVGLAALAFGAALPAAATMWPFYAHGLWSDFWDWNVARNLTYPPPMGWGFILLQEAAAHLVGAMGWAVVLAVRPYREALLRLVRRQGETDPTRLLLVLLVPLVCFAVSSGLRFYSHYFIQLAWPLALLAGPRLVALLEEANARGARRMRVGLAVAVLLPVVGFFAVSWVRGLLGTYPGQDAKVRAIAAFLNQPQVPAGRMALWGDSTQLYLYTNRMPASRFYNAAPLVGNFDTNHVPDDFDVRAHISHRDVATYLRDFAARPPAVFVDTSPSRLHDWHRLPMDAVNAVREYVRAGYTLAGEPAGARVWVRRPNNALQLK